MRNLGEKSE